MAEDSSSTFAEVEAAYDDNAGYDVNGSVEECKLFIVAGRILLRRLNEQTKQGDDEARKRTKAIQDAVDEALKWWKANDTAATTTSRSTTNFKAFTNFKD